MGGANQERRRTGTERKGRGKEGKSEEKGGREREEQGSDWKSDVQRTRESRLKGMKRKRKRLSETAWLVTP